MPTPTQQPENIPICRMLLGIGLMLIIAAVAVGAAFKGQAAIAKYLLIGAVVLVLIGGIGSALSGHKDGKDAR